MPSQQKFDRKLGVRQEPALLDLALKVLSLDEVGDVVLIAVLLALLHVLVALGELAEGGKGVGAELVEDARDELGELLVLTVAVDGEGVGGNGGVDLGRGEVDDVAVRLEHVDLLDSLDGLDVELLQGSLELLVVTGGAAGNTTLLRPSGGALATSPRNSAELLEAFLNVGHIESKGTRGLRWDNSVYRAVSSIRLIR